MEWRIYALPDGIFPQGFSFGVFCGVALTIGLLTGFIVGGCMGVLGWAFLQNLFAIPICAGIGMLIGIVIGTLIDYGKNHQEK